MKITYKRILSQGIYFALCGVLLIGNIDTFATTATRIKPRVIATTDGELDDRSSMVRFLLYACDYDIVGIVQVNGVQESGHSSEKWIEALIDKYDQCLSNLHIHNPDYPDKEYLLSVLKVGNENSADLGKAPPLIADNEGAQLIIKLLTDDDPRPVHILSWGGANTQANALWQIKTNYPDKWPAAAAKARLYCIWYQDGGGLWIQKNLPEVKMYASCVTVDVNSLTYKNNDDSWRYVWDYMSVDYYWKNRLSQNPKAIQTIMDKPWLAENIKVGHGSLAAAYSQEYTSEGDTPSFMPLVDNGLQQDTDYTLGGWGGRPISFSGLANIFVDGGDDNAGKTDYHYTFYRWLPAVQNDWAARADWCVADDYSKANHQPVAKVKGDLVRNVNPGQTVTLDASESNDPDGNTLSYKWWQYFEVDNATTKLTINNNTSMDNASFVVPDELNKQLHVMLEVTDNGIPVLTRYQRIIFNISNEVAGLPVYASTDVSIYPNPVIDELKISINNYSSIDCNMCLYDCQGVMILNQKLTERENVMNLRSIPKGIYFITINSIFFGGG